MEKTILKRKNWQIFLSWIVVQFIVMPVVIIVSWSFGPGPESVTIKLIEFFVTGIAYFSYPLIVGGKLNRLVAGHEKFKVTSTQFISSCLVIMVTGYIVHLTLNIAPPWEYLIPVIAISCFFIILA